ncbi:uncharacterized protein TRUGW13939_10150 [Talaromyces rugulosus]|uniref:Acyltransferase 3 domain-containing protein n=1 Tax=Talaromyces rugulosus TaxID=121627 RepID=A0A7H8R9E9_TALRU|nr:uncharacterized protein TRUGW13939_10150 [Talaromyces rugulosus]QKX62982.1 hypothetical protein TRUGW13939_10150 [Talaromyces rugulosus]
MGTEGVRKASPNRLRTSSWADGLRGIASIFVVSSHLVLCFARWVLPPLVAETGKSLLFQLPYFRLIAQGNAWVAIFFVLLGYVNSLKAVQLARAGAVGDALNSLASSTFRRTGRLVFPATAVTVLAWFICQLGAYQLGRRTDAWWVRETSAKPSTSWFGAPEDLFIAVVRTWTEGENPYDQPQWALIHLFKGSLYVFLTLLALVNTSSKFRLTAEAFLYIYSWYTGDAIVGINVYAGMMLAELSMDTPSEPIPRTKSRIRLPIRESGPYIIAALGLYLCSFPDSSYEMAAWSTRLWKIGQVIFPSNAQYGRFWPGIGAQMLTFAILHSPSMRRALSHPWLMWIGGLSFPLYLLHGPLIRSLMTYMVFLIPSITFTPDRLENGSPDPNSLIPIPNTFVLCLTLPVFFAILLVLSKLWAIHVDPWFGVWTDAFEQFARSWGNEQIQSFPWRKNKVILPLHGPKT